MAIERSFAFDPDKTTLLEALDRDISPSVQFGSVLVTPAYCKSV